MKRFRAGLTHFEVFVVSLKMLKISAVIDGENLAVLQADCRLGFVIRQTIMIRGATSWGATGQLLQPHRNLQNRGGQLAARGPHVARHSVFSGPRKHSGKIIKSEISSNSSQ